MALKPDREYNEITDIANFWDEDETRAIEKGGMASVVTSSSGAAMGTNYTDEANVVDYDDSVGSSTVPKGILLQNVALKMSTTRDFINHYTQEIRPGDKCTLVRHGWVVTDMITPGQTPAIGGTAYLGQSGLLATGAVSSSVAVGRFETTKDGNGFCRVFIDL
ncbi:hypothetical protein LCGC14_0141060 [marine sediment metagenome]|uniref:Uncharacterized protein n=1 Tax=marine sediment metagenome TaxID=412755 RepID=A0A0F9V0X0_9ZZZZ